MASFSARLFVLTTLLGLLHVQQGKLEGVLRPSFFSFVQGALIERFESFFGCCKSVFAMFALLSLFLVCRWQHREGQMSRLAQVSTPTRRPMFWSAIFTALEKHALVKTMTRVAVACLKGFAVVGVFGGID